ncbi:hypothetical protein GCM10010345_20050 [Streptomyces canarius]|uniref:Uncharacterized protein n=1 Tax=Streptomyces canarius TaxID=285453 RepID=A0ABQ3CI70_9ACTN|nr:hypothetical protein GCM10010345_20050 [Streptomyces canarius]
MLPDVSACAPRLHSARIPLARRTVDPMGDTRELECVGRGDDSGCPHGAVRTIDAGIPVYRCDDCRSYWELDETEPGRRASADDALTRPLGDPGEAGQGTAA